MVEPALPHFHTRLPEKGGSLHKYPFKGTVSSRYTMLEEEEAIVQRENTRLLTVPTPLISHENAVPTLCQQTPAKNLET